MLRLVSWYRPAWQPPASVLPRIVMGWAVLSLGSFVLGQAETVRDVGPGRAHATLADALSAASPGETIVVHPRADGQPYEAVGLRIKTPGLTIRAADAPYDASEKADEKAHGPAFRPTVTLSGRGMTHSGAGAVSRAILQFDPGADGCSVIGFVLTGATNDSGNGAGIRINGANDITVQGCEIHHNDMGIMSAPGSETARAKHQRIDTCHIHHNGSEKHAGYNHNLYLGGENATVIGCRISHSTTGHNLKSRSHQLHVEACFLSDAANRDIDLVDAQDTAAEGSDAWIVGNLIVKRPDATGNRTILHFGQDIGGARRGTLHLVANTIVTPFVSPIVDLSTPDVRLVAQHNLITSGAARQANQIFLNTRNGASDRTSQADANWLGTSFEAKWPSAFPQGGNRFASLGADTFRDVASEDYRLATSAAGRLTADGIKVASDRERDAVRRPRYQPRPPVGYERRTVTGDPVVGAFGT